MFLIRFGDPGSFHFVALPFSIGWILAQTSCPAPFGWSHIVDCVHYLCHYPDTPLAWWLQMTHKKRKISEMRKPVFVNTITWPREACAIPGAMWELSSSSRMCDYLKDPKVFSLSHYHSKITENGWGKNPSQIQRGIPFIWYPWVPYSRRACFQRERGSHTHSQPRIPQVLKEAGVWGSSSPFIAALAQEALTFQRQASAWLAVPNIYIPCSFIPNFPGSCMSFYNW